LAERPEWFRAVFGGYGGLAIVTEIELVLTENVRIERIVEKMPLSAYGSYFYENIAANPEIVLHNADLTPPAFNAPLAVSWWRTEKPVPESLRLISRGQDYDFEQNVIWALTELPGGEHLRRMAVEPLTLNKPAVVWRNYEASLDTASLEPRTRVFSTYLLQEYFIPAPEFLSFATAIAKILKAHEVDALNVSVRHSPADKLSLLRWAPVDVFSFVLYYKRRRHERANDAVERWTRELIDAALACGGRYYLPYRLDATPEQFRRAYPEVSAFLALKKTIDADYRFRNLLWDKYLPAA